MKKIGMFFIVIMLLTGCSTISTAPINKKEIFPSLPNNPTVGLIINSGTIHLNLHIYDRSGRLVESIYTEGADKLLETNGRPAPNILLHQLPLGNYKVEIYPFYYRFVLTKWKRYRIDLLKQTASITVDKRLDSYYKGRYYGWLLYLNAGDIPKFSNGLPGLNFNLQGQFWKDLGLAD